ncbi:hypothetical protein O181_115001 [Austropuccinia psidii MF-1]|uniref:Uncharacterized protein n=1 Tax=Austropuccinia psidii MF-1 TaxID=1389203 RepID=A0A9Q3PVT6_9BASI|nr:hypothetical protein [Austropuccinia psidii MF-1]
MSELPEKIPLIIMDSSESPSLFVTHHTRYMVDLHSFPIFKWEFLVIYTPKGKDLTLGFEFLNNFNPSIGFMQGLITFNFDYKNSSDSLHPLSNEIATSSTCASFIGNSRAPSFPSSVHITALNYPLSLLLSRNEVLKQMKDVGEDNSISLLHLFHGKVDLPRFIIMTSQKSCGMKRNSQKKLKP